MPTLVHPSWVGLLVTRLPRRLVKALDDWSYRVARRKAESRRAAALKRQAARP